MLQFFMIVGSVSPCVLPLQLRPAAPVFPSSNPLSRYALASLVLARPALNLEGSCKWCALLYQSETHPLRFQLLPFILSLEGHSLRVYPGCHQERPSTFKPSKLLTFNRLTPLESALTSKHRVLPCFGRDCPPATLLESTLTRSCPASSLESALTKKPGVGT